MIVDCGDANIDVGFLLQGKIWFKNDEYESPL